MTAKRTSRICPRCGSTDTMPIRSGWPEPELGQKSPREGPIGGRILGIDNPNRVCKKCGHQWQTRTRG